MSVCKLLLVLSAAAALVQGYSEVIPLGSLNMLYKDEALTAALKQAEMNLAPSLLQTSRTRARVTPDSEQIPLSDVFFHANNDTTIELTNLRLSGVQVQGLDTVSPDLTYVNMKLALPMGTLKITCNYSVVSENFLDAVRLTNEGELSIILSEVQGEGLVGLALNEELFHTSNFDMKYTPSDVMVMAARNTQHGLEVTQWTKNTVENQLVNKLWREIKYHLNVILQKELDNLLEMAPARRFMGSERMVQYRNYVQAQSKITNKYIDDVLQRLDQYIAKNNKAQIALPTFYAGFSKKIWFVTWHGSFSMRDGYVRSLSTIKRRSDVTLSYDNGKLVMISSLGLDELKVGYNYWRAEFMNIGPKGTLDATPRYNSVFLKASVTIGSKPTAALEEFYVEHLDGIQIHITGLGILNWLLSTIASWVTGFFNGKILEAVNKVIHSNMDQIIGQLNPNDYFT